MTEIEKKFEDQRTNKFKPEEDKSADPQENLMSLVKNL